MTISGSGNDSAAPAVADLPPGLLDEVADLVAGALPAVADRIPAAEAEAVGRQGVPGAPGLSTSTIVAQHVRPTVVAARRAFAFAPNARPSTPAGLRPVRMPQRQPGSAAPPQGFEPDGLFLGRRVLDPVRPVLDGLPLDAPAELVRFVGAPRLPDGNHVLAEIADQDPTRRAADRLRRFGPHVIPWITVITAALADDRRVAPLLRVGAGTEPEVVAAHGRAHLALAVLVSAIVLPAADVPLAGSGPEAVVGAALDAAVRVLRARPMPDAYAAALLERRRAEYTLPNFAHGDVPVRGHRFGLLEGPLPAEKGEPADGVVTVVPGGLVLRTGTEDGSVHITVQVLPGPPPVDDTGRDLAVWREVVDVSFTADAGAASVVTAAGAVEPRLSERTPPWPGSMRARVAARGRDEGEDRYEIVVWAAPPAPEVVHKATDRLGHRLRGEPEPPVVVPPEAAYRWLRDSRLSAGVTVTVVTGSSPDQVVEAFGADPAQPVPLDDDLALGDESSVVVLPVDGAVIAVEMNGWQGSRDPVLRAASARGRAASMYWNGGNALTNLAFARHGEVLDSFEPLFAHDASDDEVRAALAGIDWLDFTGLHEKGLVAVEQFTGHGIRPQDVDRMDALAVVYLIPGSG